MDKDKVIQVINSIRPYLQKDGGDVEIVEMTDDGVVKLRLQGACGSCPSALYTLHNGIEAHLREHVSGFKAVERVG